MTVRSVTLSLSASLGATLVALCGWWLGDVALDATGLSALRPITLLAFGFLSLTLLQAAWDRATHLLKHRAFAKGPNRRTS